ncbi:intercellular adhesion molecule 5-like isoform X2 [Hemicordylus capensis]|uniref:intercellular adhesion molecule 5-like isoform X2 n=1 Tax=Hemicordylus capensis TaxID=884348 RepID=UPI00230420A5|nr:intercellular adhesion molecule 5-like isoform X2 [Hemicordylus capensis]
MSGGRAGAQGAASVRIWPEKAVVEFGGSIVFNCSTTCKDFIRLGLETKESMRSRETGTTWATFELLNVSNWDTKPSCYALCTSASPQHAAVTVYRSPERIVLDPLPEMEVGKEYNLTCRVHNVAPRRNLTVTFLKAETKLHQETFKEHSALEAGDVVATHSITAQLSDNGEEFSCQAALDLRPEGQLFEKASQNQSVTVVDFPVDPRLNTLHDILEISTEMDVECEVAGVFPAKEARFDLTFAGERLKFSVNVWNDTATAKAQASSSSVGKHELNCTVSLGPIIRTATKTVAVYSLPDPILHVDPQAVLVNEAVTFTCNSSGTGSPGIKMQIRDAKETFASASNSSLQVVWTAQEEDDGREFTCEVELMVDGHPVPVVKKTSAKLTVFYGPRMNDTSCPSSLDWTEGNEETFFCSAWGNPKPTIECRKDTVLYKLGTPQRITRDQDGLYRCNATNEHGSDVRYVTIRIEFTQPNTLLIGLLCLGAVAIACVAGVAYRMYYNAHKIRKYVLKQKQQAAGHPMEQKSLNGNAQTETDSC